MQTPPADVQQPPKVTPLEVALLALQEAYDLDAEPGPEPLLRPEDRPAYRWMRACMREDLPGNPFPMGGPAFVEAEALRAFLALPPDKALEALPGLKMREAGSPFALWRWGQRLARKGILAGASRRAFENKVLASPGTLSQGYALRHALCHALAEGDETRLGALRARVPQGQEDVFTSFQAAFGLLGARLPVLRLWTLPGAAAEEVELGREGGALWICPYQGPGLPALPTGTTWIIPTRQGEQDEREPQLRGHAIEEARALGGLLETANRTARLAASRGPFERLGLVHFPILITFDGQGRVQRIRMGDAAPGEPGR